MENETPENETPTNETEVTVENTEEDAEVTPKTYSEEEVAELRKKADLAENYKIRAEKAEKKIKEPTPPKKEVDDEPKLSTMDIISLRDVHEDDVYTVLDWAKFKKISVAEAKKDKTLQIVLQNNAAERKTANATTVKGGPRVQQKNVSEDLLRDAETKNLVPEDEDDIEKLVEAREARLRKKK